MPTRETNIVQGLRRIQVWVPETRTERFRAEAHSQSLAVAQSEGERDDQTFIEAITDCDLKGFRRENPSDSRS